MVMMMMMMMMMTTTMMMMTKTNEAIKHDDYDNDDKDDDDDDVNDDDDHDDHDDNDDDDDDDDMAPGDRMAVSSRSKKGSRSRVKANITRSILFWTDSPVLPSLGSADCITAATGAAVTLFAAAGRTHPRVSDARSDGHSSMLHH